ncbi:MAG: helix-turn-helix transcriptional regulator, partial [Alphaproteobacteria bacterium]|nr:helix-turn-helix transcriptional regulator [Alphaproteobacteria bacterium]
MVKKLKLSKPGANRAEKRQIKLDAILRHAAAAFMEKGYYKTSLEDIARRHQVTKPTLYYYIRNKEDIL